MPLFDSHCHLDFPVFDAQREALMQQAKVEGISQILVPGVTAGDFERVLSLRQRWPEQLVVALGLHPCFLEQHTKHCVDRLADALQREADIVAVGEIGLDFRANMAVAEVQVMLLKQQLDLARQHELPVILHVVKAHERMLSLLKRYRLAAGGVVHAYSGSIEQAREYAKLGFRLGIGGTITYPRARRQQQLAAELPLEWMLLETDAPDMSLYGFTDQPNSPLQVLRVAQQLASLRGIPIDQIAEQTLDNAMTLFRLH
ncbi:TatD family hydrolase [Nitrincola sp.]|uniref:TatD family hydrolase n=1 Tax=Nitrincola sp. TaxID=1926584 RepID=UPI003A8FD7F8